MYEEWTHRKLDGDCIKKSNWLPNSPDLPNSVTMNTTPKEILGILLVAVLLSKGRCNGQ
ncbi:hypothetical protein [Yoonia sp. R2-816]|uniref:hypothetical protein n=1 Tax=Yoonia sp. R2-816 TaxID=3342638 RepID=UPI00372D75B4